MERDNILFRLWNLEPSGIMSTISKPEILIFSEADNYIKKALKDLERYMECYSNRIVAKKKQFEDKFVLMSRDHVHREVRQKKPDLDTSGTDCCHTYQEYRL